MSAHRDASRVEADIGCSSLPIDASSSNNREAGYSLSSVPSAPNPLATPTQPMSKPQVAYPAPAPAPKVEPAKPKKPRPVYYNIVGEPVSSDDD